MGFIFYENVQLLRDLNFQHPQYPVGKSHNLAVCPLENKQKALLFFLLGLPTASFDILLFL